MEDKQIYSSARSEEIKRQLSNLKSKFQKALAERSKRQKEKKVARESKAKVAIQTQTKSSNKKAQNIQITSEYAEKPKTEKAKKKAAKDEKKNFPSISAEKLFPFLVYTLLAIIILIVALGIFLTYRR
jgi:cobalamin biosynthesis Mg chelatase CobN